MHIENAEVTLEVRPLFARGVAPCSAIDEAAAAQGIDPSVGTRTLRLTARKWSQASVTG